MTDESEKADIVDRLRMAARVGDVPFYYDDAGKMVFHDDTMSEAAAEITSLRKQLEEARADKRMVDGLLTAAVDDYNNALKERDDARKKALEEAQEAVRKAWAGYGVSLVRINDAIRSLAQEGDKP